MTVLLSGVTMVKETHRKIRRFPWAQHSGNHCPKSHCTKPPVLRRTSPESSGPKHRRGAGLWAHVSGLTILNRGYTPTPPPAQSTGVTRERPLVERHTAPSPGVRAQPPFSCRISQKPNSFTASSHCASRSQEE